MELWTAKLLAGLGLWIIPFIATVIPIKLYDIFQSKGQKGRKYLSVLMCFGGGVFIGTFLLHMMPESSELIIENINKKYDIEYPVAEIILFAGFFLVMFIEKVVLKLGKGIKDKKVASPENGDVNIVQSKDNTPSTKLIRFGGMKYIYKQEYDNTVSVTVSSDTLHPPEYSQPRKNATLATGIACDESAGPYERSSRSFLLVLALSLHRIFEGMSVGLKTTDIAVAKLFVALIFHEPIIGFSLGLQFVKSNFSTVRIVLYAFVCSLIIPLGIVIGAFIIEFGRESAALNGVNGLLQAISTGVFIYVTFFEILQDEITHSDSSISKVMSILLGFAVMAALSAIPHGHAHGHEDEGCHDHGHGTEAHLTDM